MPTRQRCATNDAGVSSHTVRQGAPRHPGDLAASATAVSNGTACELGNSITPGPVPENLPKCFSVANVQENWNQFFVVRNAETLVLRSSAVPFASPGMNIGAHLRDVVQWVGCRSLRLTQTEPDLTLIEKGARLYWAFYAYRLIKGRLISSTRNK
jgi:hypothetical protein